MKHQIYTSIEINATPALVWKAFMDFEKYPAWNTFIKSLSGNTNVGGKFTVELDNMTFKPKTLVNTPEKEFTWLGHLGFPGIFDGEHAFILDDNKDGTTTFIQKESFKGILIRFMRKKLDGEVKYKFEKMNRELKNYVEKGLV